MRKVIYTCIVGGYEKLRVPGYITEGWETVIFSDKPVEYSGWMQNIVIPSEDLLADPRRTARRIKLLSHHYLPKTDVSFWMDANMQITCDLNKIMGKFLTDKDIATFMNPRRVCIYQEGAKIKRQKQDKPDIVDAQVARYRAEKYPKHHGLICSNVLMRRHSPKVIELNEMWWAEMVKGSRRDQLSFNYVAWRLGVGYNCIERNHSHSLNFRYRPHGR